MSEYSIGSSDLKDVCNSSIEMQGGDQSATIQPVEGVMGCSSTNGDAQIEWTIRKPF